MDYDEAQKEYDRQINQPEIITPRDKYNALSTLVPNGAELKPRDTGRWSFALRSVEIGDGPFLTSEWSSGNTPDEAIEKYYARLTTGLKCNERVVVNAYKEDRCEYVWNGKNWIKVK